jgi:hypothetical protein
MAAVAAVAVAAALGGVAAMSNSGGSKGLGRGPGSEARPPALPSDTSMAIVPHNNVAYIYNLFGLVHTDVNFDELRHDLTDEGYDVTVFVDTTEGAGSQGGGTLANFIRMAKDASVVIVNGHGFDFSGNEQPGTCPSGKSITRCDASPSDSTPGTAIPGHNFGTQPGLQVEWYPTWQAEKSAYQRYLDQGINPNWLVDPPSNVAAPTLVDWRQGDLPKGLERVPNEPDRVEGTRPWLGISAAGIAHYFQNAKLDLADVLNCHSMALASSFGARSYFGHTNEACSGFEQKDEPLLFDRLIGKSGVPARTTTEAMRLGGFQDKFFGLAPDSKPVVLSPAVESVSPQEGSRVGQNSTTPAEVQFDAEMDTSNTSDVVAVSGCGASIQNMKWTAANRLTFDIKVPANPADTTMTITLHSDRARAAPGDFPNQQLDGNSDPSGSGSGLLPNRDDYTYQLSCSTASSLTVRYTGTFTDAYIHPGGSYHVKFSWNESRRVEYTYKDFLFTTTPGALTLTASGSATASADSNPDNQPLDNCSYGVASNPIVQVGVLSEGDSAKGGGRPLTINVGAQMPVSTGEAGNDRQLSHSGVCTNSSIDGPLPFLHQNPLGGTFDPGSFLQAAWNASAENVSVADLTKQPFTKNFPVDYTQTDKLGGTDHAVVKATLTVSAS